MNSKQFVNQVFELIWNCPGAKVEHYQNGIADWPGREKYFTYENTLIKMKLAIDCIRAHSEIDNKEIKNINFDKL